MSHYKVVAIASTNNVKIDAVLNVLDRYEISFENHKGYKCSSGVRDQPLGDNECMTGAINRAHQALKMAKDEFGEGDMLVFGIESGCFTIGNFPVAKQREDDQSSLMEATFIHVIKVYKGITESFWGMSPAWQVPNCILKHLPSGKDLSQISKDIGLTTSSTIGEEEGIIGLLTKGKVTRKEYTEQGIMLAMISVINKFSLLNDTKNPIDNHVTCHLEDSNEQSSEKTVEILLDNHHSESTIDHHCEDVLSLAEQNDDLDEILGIASMINTPFSRRLLQSFKEKNQKR